MAISKKRKTSSSKWSAERRARFNAKKAARDRSNAIPLVREILNTAAIQGERVQERLDSVGVNRSKTTSDPVNHPVHYNTHPAGIECIDVVEWLPFNVGNAIKYLWRAPHKSKGTSTSTELQDLKKAIWYIQREIERRTKELTSGPR